MGFEAASVAEVYAPTGGTAADFGSGYLVADGLVLTARHIVERSSGPCQVRFVGQEHWSDAAGVWRGMGACDAALLRIAQREPRAPARLGRLATGARAECRALGFPLAQARGRVRDTEEIVGEVAPLSAYKSGLLTVSIAGSVPDRDSSGHSPWEGYSGAALFCGQLLVGVLTVDPVSFGTSRLKAVPVTAMADDLDFRAALGAPAPERLPALEDESARGVLSPPYTRLPVRATAEFLRRSPIHLLYPQYGVVPFHGREAELADLTQWLEGGEVALGLLLGRGGSGKTRLAAEFCRTHADGLWVGGFAVPGADVEVLASAVSPLLLIVDEAETRVDELAAFISHFARVGRREPTRLLLVSREGGEWWEESLPRRLDIESRALLDLPWEREVLAFDERLSARNELFETAARSFAAKTERSSENLVQPDLTLPAFDRILFIHFAALTALEAERLPRGGVVGWALLEERIAQERRYWESSARQEGLHTLDPRVLQRAVAVSTLTTAATEGESADLLAAIPDLADEGEGLRRQVARWLRSLYPGEGFFRPLEPDLLGEQLVGFVLGDVPELPSNLLAQLTTERATRTLTVLTRAAQVHETAEAALREALREHLASLWNIAIDVAEETGDPIGRLLAEVLAATPEPHLAVQIMARLPTETIALRELAAVAAQQALESARAEPAGLDRDEDVADLLNQLSNRLSDLGRDDEALATIEEAVAIGRRLADEDPDTFLTDLSRSLTNLSLRLYNVGRYREALEAGEEAVAVDRALADADPEGFLPALSASLNNYSNALEIVGRDEEALVAIEETVAINRDLAKADPDVFLPNLAVSLSSLFNRLNMVGRDEEALVAIREAVAVGRDLVDANPDAFLPELAASLNNLSISLAALGRNEQALAAAEESVAIQRRLADIRPDAFVSGLAESLNNLSVWLDRLDRDEEALAAIEETVAIKRRLAEANPDASLADLAGSLNNLATLLDDLGRTEHALAAVDEAVAIGRNLVDADPDVFLPNLGMSLINLALILGGLDRDKEALAAREEAVAISRGLAEARPQAFLSELLGRLESLSNALDAAGRDEDAVAALEEAVSVGRRLADADPDESLAKLAESLTTLGKRLPDLERGEDALAALEEAVAINRRLADADPAFLPELADSLDLLAAFRNAFGFADNAVSATEAVAINRRLAEADPDRLASLAESLDNLYLALAMQGRGEEALAALEEEVATNRRLVDVDPDAFLPNLADSLGSISLRLQERDRHAEAVAASEEAVAISRRLAKADRVGFVAKLAESLDTHAYALSGLDRGDEALAASEEAVGIGRRLAVNDPDRFGVQAARWLNTFAAFLNTLERGEQAAAALGEAVAIGRDRADSEELADWLDSLAVMLYDLERDEDAVAASEEAVELNRQLADADPDASLPKLAESLDTLSLALYALDRDQEAVTASEEAVAIGREFATDGADSGRNLARWLTNLSNALDAVGRREEAGTALGEARAIERDLEEDEWV
jgi:hypothetical protein